MRETWVRSLGWEDPLEKGRLPTLVFWPGEFHRQSMGLQSWTRLSDFHFHFASCIAGRFFANWATGKPHRLLNEWYRYYLPSVEGSVCASSMLKALYLLFHLIFTINCRYIYYLSFPGSSNSKASACSVGDLGSIPGSGRSPGEGNGNPLQYSCLENSLDGGAW